MQRRVSSPDAGKSHAYARCSGSEIRPQEPLVEGIRQPRRPSDARFLTSLQTSCAAARSQRHAASRGWKSWPLQHDILHTRHQPSATRSPPVRRNTMNAAHDCDDAQVHHPTSPPPLTPQSHRPEIESLVVGSHRRDFAPSPAGCGPTTESPREYPLAPEATSSRTATMLAGPLHRECLQHRLERLNCYRGSFPVQSRSTGPRLHALACPGVAPHHRTILALR